MIRIATKQDIENLLALYEQARAFMGHNGLAQWQGGYPQKEIVENDVSAGHTRVFEENGEILGCAAFIDREPDYDVIYDGKWKTHGRFIAVHRVAVGARRKGIASAFFKEALREAGRKGFASVRIDTHKDNAPMRAALEKNGFTYCGNIRLSRDGEWRVAYEKERPVLVAATGNRGKLREIEELLPEYVIVSQKQAGFFGEAEENGNTFLENAIIKARAASEALQLPALADDSGICCVALHGEPGIHSARYVGRHGDDAANNALLLKNLEGKDRSAYFYCAVALVFPDSRILSGEGKTDGYILERAEGENGFGYDPLFFSTELNKPFGIASAEEKNSVSHRYRALKELSEKL